jgi:hypothetical protein
LPALNSTNLIAYAVENAGLTGSIPDSVLASKQLKLLDLPGNHVLGHIDYRICEMSELRGLMLDNNGLGGSIPPCICNLVKLTVISAVSNNLEGTVPDCLSSFPLLKRILLSNNRLEGELPALPPSIEIVQLQANHFSGPIDRLIRPDTKPSIINLSQNHLTGTIPEFWGPIMAQMNRLLLFNNLLEGQIPDLYSTEEPLREKSNQPTIAAQRALLDFSNNQFTGTLPSFDDSCPQYISIDFSRNRLQGTIPDSWAENNMKIIKSLDLSWNRGLIGTIPTDLWANSRLRGSSKHSTLTHLRIGYNQFKFNMSEFERSAILEVFSAERNRIYGAPLFSRFPSLVSLDLTYNQINETFDWDEMEKSSILGRLRSVNLDFNPIPPFSGIPSGLEEDSTTYIEHEARDGVWHMGCHPMKAAELTLDFVAPTSIFSYKQCHCMRDHYGPNCFCLPCPVGVQCFEESFTLLPGYYMYPSPEFSYNGTAVNCADIPRAGISELQPCSQPILTEKCGSKNCIGTEFNLTVAWAIPWEAQCSAGSGGRQCSECVCDLEDPARPCYVSAGGACTKCSYRLSWTQVVFIFLPIALALTSIISLAMYKVLKAARAPPEEDNYDKSWEELSFGRRFGTRFVIFLKALLSIFPMAYEFYQTSTLVRPSSQVGPSSISRDLRCIFPSLTLPQNYLTWQTTFPFALFAWVSLCVIIAEFFTRCNRRGLSKHRSDSSQSLVSPIATKTKSTDSPVGSEMGHMVHESTNEESGASESDWENLSSSALESAAPSEELDTHSRIVVPRKRVVLEDPPSIASSPAVESNMDSFSHHMRSTEESDHAISFGTALKRLSEEKDGSSDGEYEEELNDLLPDHDVEEELPPISPRSARSEFTPAATTSDFLVLDPHAPREFPFLALICSLFFQVFSFCYIYSASATLEYWFSNTQACTQKKFIIKHPFMQWSEASTLRWISVPPFIFLVAGYPITSVSIGIWASYSKSQSVQQYVGGIIKSLTTNRAWWGGVVFARRFLIVVLCVGLPALHAWRYGALTLLLSTFLMLTLSLRPWKLRIQNSAEALMLTIQVINVATVEVSGTPYSNILSIIVTIINYLLFLWFASYATHHAWSSEPSYVKKWRNHHSSGADSAH